MKKTIKVIKTDKGYVKRHEYSQGESSFSTTDDPLKAFDINADKYGEDILEFFFGWIGKDGVRHCRHDDVNPTIEVYEVEVNRTT